MTRATSAHKRAGSTGKRGRQSLITDAAIVAAFLEALRAGNWLTTAAGVAGLSKSTVDGWVSRGKAARALDETGEPVPADGRVYLDFLADYDRAEAEAESTIVGNLRRLSATSPQAATSMLKLRWPERWHDPPAQIEMSGRDGSPLPWSPVLAKLTDAELDARIAALEAEIEAEKDAKG